MPSRRKQHTRTGVINDAMPRYSKHSCVYITISPLSAYANPSSRFEKSSGHKCTRGFGGYKSVLPYRNAGSPICSPGMDVEPGFGCTPRLSQSPALRRTRFHTHHYYCEYRYYYYTQNLVSTFVFC